MPLIRYNQADDVVLKMTDCVDDLPFIESINGRSFEKIVLPNGNEINAILLLEIISQVNNQFDGILLEYKFLYFPTQRHIICQVMIDPCKEGWFKNVDRAIHQAFSEKLFDVNSVELFEVVLVDQIVRKTKNDYIEIVK